MRLKRYHLSLQNSYCYVFLESGRTEDDSSNGTARSVAQATLLCIFHNTKKAIPPALDYIGMISPDGIDDQCNWTPKRELTIAVFKYLRS